MGKRKSRARRYGVGRLKEGLKGVQGGKQYTWVNTFKELVVVYYSNTYSEPLY